MVWGESRIPRTDTENGSSSAEAMEDMGRALHVMPRDLGKMIILSSRVMSPVSAQ